MIQARAKITIIIITVTENTTGNSCDAKLDLAALLEYKKTPKYLLPCWGIGTRMAMILTNRRTEKRNL
jgi:hypothetical protein